MRHRRLRRKLGVKSNHRKALLRNLVRNLVIHKQIQTTFAKAKEASAFADRMVQIAKEGSLHSRRLLISKLGNSQTAHQLITQIAPHFKERKGGYTRVLRMGNRVGDAADMALLEFTAVIESPEKKKAKKEKAKKPAESVKEVAPEPKKKAKEETKSESRKEDKKTASSEEKKESDKKGGFLSGLRKFFKGDEQ